MADNTIIQQGSFVSTGLTTTIPLRSDIDWMETINYTASATTTQWLAVRHFWQRGMAVGDGVAYYHAAATSAMNILPVATGWNGAVYPGFYLIDSSAALLGPNIAVTAGTNATQPVYSTANTALLAAGSIVRINNTAHTNINGLDFSVDTIVANTSFRLANTLATAPGAIAGAAGFWRYVAPDLETYKLFYPANRTIANISQAANAVVTTLVDHGYTTGQQVRIKVPAACGMIEINDLTGTVTNINASTFSININTTTFTAFNFPLPAAVPFTPAEVIPAGETPNLLGLLGDSTTNVGYIGMMLGAGVGGPAGQVNDVIYWKAGKSFNV